MKHLDLYDVLAVAARVLECDPAAAIRRTELDVVDAVLREVAKLDDVVDAGAALLSGLVRGRPFSCWNRRVSVAVTLQLVAVNRCDLRLEPVEEFDDLLDRIRSGEASPSAVAELLRARLISPLAFASLASFALEGPTWEETVMYEKFSDAARQVVALAQEQARDLYHQYIGTEHLLLGLLEENTGVAAQVLAGCGVSAPAVRTFVEQTVGRGQDESSGFVPFTPRAKKVLELSHKVSLQLGSDRIGTEHLLLGLLQEGGGLAAQAIVKGGTDLSHLKRQLMQTIEQRKRAEAAVQGFLTEGAQHSGTWVTHDRRRHLVGELNTILDENERLHEEITRLRQKLRAHDIDPDD
ncbi:Clp protease N-terminal domain-containing protein [Kribbella sp. VKM Ac-2568]|uniref:Clp protease N-terminal domain-containing protein n=1 Tax=Kribbella sp. VKM Ac-2568 TaxID=2512219 RepID=UPI00104F8900|nr:Clp protease N-terminal domain-containing protein [Kribbella sp. VKM Ac-2568]TCM42655.1 ClpA/ClpB-like protein [Kribbella sp. VKM Ac-2568]